MSFFIKIFSFSLNLKRMIIFFGLFAAFISQQYINYDMKSNINNFINNLRPNMSENDLCSSIRDLQISLGEKPQKCFCNADFIEKQLNEEVGVFKD